MTGEFTADLADPGQYVEAVPHAAFKWLRENDPVHWHRSAKGDGFWAITRYRDVMAVSADPGTFSSARAHGGFRLFDEEQNARSLGASLLSMDPPEHLHHRQSLLGTASAARTRELEGSTRERAQALIEAMIHKARQSDAELDLVSDFAMPLTIGTLAELLGAAQADVGKLARWSNAFVGEDDPEVCPDRGYLRQCAWEMLEWATPQFEARRDSRGDDVISAIVTCRENGLKVGPAQVAATLINLIVAGNETTRNSITGGVLALCENSGQKAALILNPALASQAVGEIIRWVSPIIHMRRTSTCRTELGGKVIEAGERVVMWYPSANRDEEIFDRADDFDIHRTAPPRHIGFGHGEHVCLGQRLAEMQIRVALEELLKRIPNIEPLAKPRRLRSNFVNGYKSLRIRIG